MITTLEQFEDVMTTYYTHVPVMGHEIKQYLHLGVGACVVDGTLGLGGHAQLLADQIGPEGHYIGIDRDKESLNLAQANLKNFSDRCVFIHDDFRHMDRILKSLHIDKVDGFLFDLGISSFQIDNPDRGFSIRSEGPLDMRMDQENCLSAYDLINSLSEKEIATVLRDYGEERWSYRIARYIVKARTENPIESTRQLEQIVLRAIPRTRGRQRIHPATRTFQAFRIAVNHELESLDAALDKCVGLLKTKARICVISFHSLEDRIVKRRFRSFSKLGILKLITKKPLRPTDEETRHNPRARSARLRVAEKI